jgi:hypothetical protein
MSEKPTFIQGLYSFEGRGLSTPAAANPPVSYTVPFEKRAQLVYFRAGNQSAELIYVLLMRRGKPLRYFPIGAKAAIHVPLAVVEDLSPETTIDVLFGAPEGMQGSVVLDIGFVEVG